MEFYLKRFDELSLDELYQLLKLRQDVFIIEQMCPFPDIDNLDQTALHLWCQQGGNMLAYLRLLPPTIERPDVVSLGRVCSALDARGGGYTRQLVQQGLQELQQRFPQARCEIGAQSYLLAFYQRAGFQVFGEPYLEDGIPHRHMVCPLAQWSPATAQ